MSSIVRTRPEPGPAPAGATSAGPYDGASTITGPLSDGQRVLYRDVLSAREKTALGALIAFQVLTGIGFLGWLMWPSHLPVGGYWFELASLFALVCMVLVEAVRLAQGAALWLFASRAKDPVPMRPAPYQRVAVLTTIVPGKEPLDLVARTLQAMTQLRYDGLVDVWLLDEGDDPVVRARCAELGVHHFSRKGVPAYNQPSGEFKAKTKAGNHNAWRDAHEDDYDVVAQMDPDHVPSPDFLERTIGYFSDPDVAFVVAPQVYGNIDESWIAHGAAIQAYVFHGVIQRGGNGMEAPLLIGTNHLYRPQAFRQIGGYQDSIIEDHYTSMVIYSNDNPATGRRWKGVYTPDILAVGEGPTSFTDYFSQQKRWAYGIWEIMSRHSPRVFSAMRPAQRLSFSLLQLFYPSVAVSWVLGNAITVLYLLAGATSRLPIAQWGVLWSLSMISSIGTFLWLRRFNLVEHERRERGWVGMGLLLLCAPVYVSAMAQFLRGKPLAYAVTAKGDATSPDHLRTFGPHLPWLGGALALLAGAALFDLGSEYPAVLAWGAWTAVLAGAPLVIHYAGRLRGRGLRRAADERPAPRVIDVRRGEDRPA
jgi:cellulose synthase/poly-beta-1,6-N-acetylglucosamine synthase-like glycosyltransferase